METNIIKFTKDMKELEKDNEIIYQEDFMDIYLGLTLKNKEVRGAHYFDGINHYIITNIRDKSQIKYGHKTTDVEVYLVKPDSVMLDNKDNYERKKDMELYLEQLNYAELFKEESNSFMDYYGGITEDNREIIGSHYFDGNNHYIITKIRDKDKLNCAPISNDVEIFIVKPDSVTFLGNKQGYTRKRLK